MRNPSTLPIVTCLLLLATTGVAQESEITHRITRDVVYGRKDGVVLTLDVHHPEKPNGAGILYMNSGGHRSPVHDLGGAWPGRRKLYAHLPLLEDGFVIFDVRHGSVPRYTVPDAVSDVKRAVSFVRQNTEKYGVEANRLGVWGASAGGHLALMVGMTSEIMPDASEGETISEPPKVSAVVAMAPMTDLGGLVGVKADFRPPGMDFGDERFPDFSPARFGSSDDPPTLLIHGDADPVVPISQSELMHASLEAAGVESRVRIIEGAGHWLYGRQTGAVREMRDWFRSHLLD